MNKLSLKYFEKLQKCSYANFAKIISEMSEESEKKFLLRSVIKRPTDSTTSTTSGQTDTTSGQTSTTNGQTSTTNGQASTTSEQTGSVIIIILY